ncbi:23S rRNA (adenine(1618)-N(6))-methyltransferase RlmF [Flavobacterium salilacus subsp. salilacus]|uniref:23S rRNA (adenine(1618)-N(6))-methyltransferase RlmF n=1 Tax=Flavobacterium TaxID=237 RepID=UPI0010755353|nr:MULTISPECIES: 23S rRNA (adenine(1618)-N(6))-methyltransferase RlmF [Flavobacterium]KAF2515829.1 23S rRNA (adenine(1618)-N(6))-methyltransferase RlmF [Flavobacterium salilacus subsp. salilacus]MBE1615366.1 23S rRNA (adenine(1618)-N(6))-methyltransferase RlmF [Flavobacterium sp. SaA2.13]
MATEKRQEEKDRLHPRNKNRERYDLNALITAVPELGNHVKPNKYGVDSVDFSSPVAVKLLNTALLNYYYDVKHWEFPDENLCPPIPGRADYIHYAADLLGESNFGRIPTGDKITCLDVGVGANCIYPILGVTEYSWKFIGTDINPKSIASAQNILDANAQLSGKVECRLQKNPAAIFQGIIEADDKIDITLCNPPFHASAEEAQKGTLRKVKNLSGKKVKTPELNFAGISNELIYDGGEHQFIHTMIQESKQFAANCFWFSTLVSKQSNLKGIYKALDALEVFDVKTILMGTGNKSTRIVAWTFLSKEEQKKWRETKWKK